MYRIAAAVAATVTLGALALPAAAQSHAPARSQDDGYHVVTTITGPGIPPPGELCSDVNYYSHGVYYLADASNRQIDRVNARTNTLMPPIGAGDFTGQAGCLSFDFSQEGPQGILTDNLGQLWAGNGDSTIHVYSLRTRREVAFIDTGGSRRADEMAYDSRDKLIIATNPDELSGVPFVSLINAVTYQIVVRFHVPGALSLEQPAYDPRTREFYMSVPVTASLSGGEIAVINPRHLRHPFVRAFPAGDCQPGGLAIDARARTMGLGCGGYGAVMNMQDGTMTEIPQIGGTDEVWYSQGRYYFGAFTGTGLGVTEADGDFITNIPVSGAGFHAAAAGRGEVFIPESGLGIVVLRRDRG
jgi:sugar lactone lactonase YvrE